MIDKEIKREVEKMIELASRRSYSKRVGDTPSDSLQLTPKKYVNAYGSIAGRPASLVASVGQQYFDTTGNRPIFFTPNTNWVDATGSVVASN